MREDGVIDTDPEAFGPAVGKEGNGDSTDPGEEKGDIEGVKAGDETQANRQDPEQASESVIEWDGPEAPAILLFEGQAAIGAAIPQAVVGPEKVP